MVELVMVPWVNFQQIVQVKLELIFQKDFLNLIDWTQNLRFLVLEKNISQWVNLIAILVNSSASKEWNSCE